MAEKRYYWMRLKDDFFSSKRIKKLRKLAGGDTYTIIYLKMQLLSLKTEGIITYSGLENTFAEELALDLDESPDNVAITLSYLQSVGLIETSDNVAYFLPFVTENIGSETAAAERSREYRASKKLPAKTNAERQDAYRAKQKCEEDGHVPYIESHMNKKRYGGNYYVCFKRDKCKCAICGSNENLCMHHIDGYDELKPENNSSNKMLTLCRECHSNVHAGRKIPEEILDRIGYYSNESNDSNVTSNVTANVEIDIEKERDIDISTPSKGSEYSDNFLQFWASYPRKVAKGDAWKAWKKVKAEQHTTEIVEAVGKAKTSPQWIKDNGQYIPYPATWLNGMRWEDEETASGARPMWDGMTMEEW